MHAHKRIIGIDLGTTRSTAAYVGPGGLVICLPDDDGEVLMPSCVALESSGSWVVGRQARSVGATSPARSVGGFKRHMGDPNWVFQVDGLTLTAPELSAKLLTQIVQNTRRVLGTVDGALIAVPAHFGDAQRSATLHAATLAGIHEVRLINEPTAAALAHAFDAYVANGGEVADLTSAAIASTAPGVHVLCDLGGGTFDVTVIRIDGHDFDVLATGGIPLGGMDWDERIVDALVRHLFDVDAPDPHHDPRAGVRMRLDAEQAKHSLTIASAAEVACPYEGVAPMPLSRSEFEQLTAQLLGQVRETIGRVLGDAGLTWSRVDELQLVGGASRMPMFRAMAAKLSGMTPDTRLQPDLIVSHGAAVYAAILQVRTECHDVAPANVPRESSPFEPHFEQVAASVRVRDVTAQSLGVVVRSPRENRKINVVLVRKNSRLPVTHSKIFATKRPNQRRVCVPVVEGSSREPNQCTPIGRCIIDPLPPNLPKGAPVEISFSYDTSGCVHVRAEELSTHTVAETTIQRETSAAAEQPTETNQPRPGPIAELAVAVAQAHVP